MQQVCGPANMSLASSAHSASIGYTAAERSKMEPKGGKSKDRASKELSKDPDLYGESKIIEIKRHT